MSDAFFFLVSLRKRGETASDGSITAGKVSGNERSVGNESIDPWKADSDRRPVCDGSVNGNTGKAGSNKIAMMVEICELSCYM